MHWDDKSPLLLDTIQMMLWAEQQAKLGCGEDEWKIEGEKTKNK